MPEHRDGNDDVQTLWFDYHRRPRNRGRSRCRRIGTATTTWRNRGRGRCRSIGTATTACKPCDSTITGGPATAADPDAVTSGWQRRRGVRVNGRTRNRSRRRRQSIGTARRRANPVIRLSRRPRNRGRLRCRGTGTEAKTWRPCDWACPQPRPKPMPEHRRQRRRANPVVRRERAAPASATSRSRQRTRPRRWKQ